MSKLLPGY